MNIACADETVVPEVRAVLLNYAVAQVRQQGPNLGSPMIWVMVYAGMGDEPLSRRSRGAGMLG